jgi:two-component system, chemotaxis family, chemotaxis protein CheV
VIPCVSLLDHLGIASTCAAPESKVILTDYNQQQTGFLVDSVDRIYRVSWESVLSVPSLESLRGTPVTGLVRCDDRLVTMLDFESILDHITDQGMRAGPVENPLGLPRANLRIVLAEDSPTVRHCVGSTLRESGYTQLVVFENGAEAWSWLERTLAERGCVDEVCDLVISDVEMPRMDGFHLTRRIKEHPDLRRLPVLIYSSIVTPENQKKGQSVGADAQVSKPELHRVVELADELISRRQREGRSGDPGQSAAPASQGEPTRPEAPGSSELAGPQGVQVRLWLTFRRELTAQVARLRELLRRAGAEGRGDALGRDLLRLLHAIKSSAAVVPLDPISRATSLVENLMKEALQSRAPWPREALSRHAQWLDMIVAPGANVDAILAICPVVEAELSSASTQG